MVILGLRMNNMGILANWGLADAANTCADDSFTGNPIARLELSAGFSTSFQPYRGWSYARFCRTNRRADLLDNLSLRYAGVA